MGEADILALLNMNSDFNLDFNEEHLDQIALHEQESSNNASVGEKQWKT